MKFKLLHHLWIILDLSLFCYTYKPTSLPDIEDQQFIQDCVTKHNSLRSQVSPSASNMRYMTWDPALAKTAKAWAKMCVFDHNTYLKIQGKVHPKFTPVGENLWTGSVSLFSVEGALRNWYNEVKNYHFGNNACSGVCGHYTQVVWATSYKVGCAVHFCPSVSRAEHIPNAAHFICNYGPAGNYPRQPYSTGRACSKCNGENCVNNLCENPERDQLMSYPSWSPDWDTPTDGGKSPSSPSKPVQSSSTCGPGCISVVILRLSLTFFSFGAVAVLSNRYPQMFIYDCSI